LKRVLGSYQKEERYSGEKYREIMCVFIPTMKSHMGKEPEIFHRLKDVDPQELERVCKEQEKIAPSKGSLWK